MSIMYTICLFCIYSQNTCVFIYTHIHINVCVSVYIYMYIYISTEKKIGRKYTKEFLWYMDGEIIGGFFFKFQIF